MFTSSINRTTTFVARAAANRAQTRSYHSPFTVLSKKPTAPSSATPTPSEAIASSAPSTGTSTAHYGQGPLYEHVSHWGKNVHVVAGEPFKPTTMSGRAYYSTFSRRVALGL